MAVHQPGMVEPMMMQIMDNSVGINYTTNRQQFSQSHAHVTVPNQIPPTLQAVQNVPGTVILTQLHQQQPNQQSLQQSTVVLQTAEETTAASAATASASKPKKPRKKKSEDVAASTQKASQEKKQKKKKIVNKDKPRRQKKSSDETVSLLGKKGKTLDAQAREIALNVAEYFKKEADLGRTLLPLHSYQKRAAAATGISTATLRKLEGARREIKSEKVAAEGMVEDPFPDLDIEDPSFLDSTDSRHKCKTCLKSRKFFCYTCCTPNPQLQDKLPRIKLPIKIDIIKHQSETDGKSTCPHAVVLAPDDVTVYTFPCIPDYDREKVVLVFPCKEACSLASLAGCTAASSSTSTLTAVNINPSAASLSDQVNAMIHSAPTTLANTDSGLHTPRPDQVGNYADIAAGSTFPDLQLQQIWNNTYYPQSAASSVPTFNYLQPMAIYQNLHHQQDQQHQQGFSVSGKRLADDEHSQADSKRMRTHILPFERAIFIDCTWNQTKTIIQDERLKDLRRVEIQGHQTQFWRCQEGIPTSCLSTIEAIYYFIREFHEQVLGETYMNEYDNLLFFFLYFYRKIREKYQGGKELKAYQRHANEAGDVVI